MRNPTLWARTGETVRITIVNGEVMVHDIALEKQLGEEPADSRAGRQHVDHLQGGAERHLLLHVARPPALGHGGPAGRLRRAADDLGRGRCPAARISGRSTSTSRAARSRTGRRRATPSRSSRRRAVPLNCATRPTIEPGDYWVSSRPGGSAKRGRAHLGAVPGHPPVRQLPGLRGRVPHDPHRARPGRGRPDPLHRLRLERRQPASRGRGSPGAGQQDHRESASWTTRPARRPRRT